MRIDSDHSGGRSQRKNSLYETLGLPKDASDDDIKRAYRQLALRYHPDKATPSERGASNEKFQEINRANNVLSNPTKRKLYDKYGDLGLRMIDQVGEERIELLLKPWLFWLICAFGVFTCGFCFCCCCFCCCFNFCCGKFRPDVTDEDNPFGSSAHSNQDEPPPSTSTCQPSPDTSSSTLNPHVAIPIGASYQPPSGATIPNSLEPVIAMPSHNYGSIP